MRCRKRGVQTLKGNMPTITIENGRGKNKLSAEEIFSIEAGIQIALEKIGTESDVIQSLQIQSVAPKGRKRYLKCKITLIELAASVHLNEEIVFQDEFFLDDGAAEYVSENILSRLTFMIMFRCEQYKRMITYWQHFLGHLTKK